MNKYESFVSNLPSMKDLVGYWIGIDEAIRLGHHFVPHQNGSVNRVAWMKNARAIGALFILIEDARTSPDPYIRMDKSLNFALDPLCRPPDREFKHISKCPAWNHYRKGGLFLEQV